MEQQQQHHKELIRGISEQLEPILEKSDQAIYVYLDDTHKVCNQKFADLLGYKSAKEWAEIDAPLVDVVEEDQKSVIRAYDDAMTKKIASDIEVRLKNVKTGRLIKTKMIFDGIRAMKIYCGENQEILFCEWISMNPYGNPSW